MRRLATMAALPMCLLALDAVAEKEGNWHGTITPSCRCRQAPTLLAAWPPAVGFAIWRATWFRAFRPSATSCFGYRSLSDLEKSRDKTHRAHVYESDPYLFYGYDWDFAEDGGGGTVSA